MGGCSFAEERAFFGIKDKNELKTLWLGVSHEGYPPCDGVFTDFRDTSRWHKCGCNSTAMTDSDFYSSYASACVNDHNDENGLIIHKTREPNKPLIECTYKKQAGEIDGWKICTREGGKVFLKEFFIDGVRSLQKEKGLQQATYFQKCEEIGFTPKTDNFSDCVLRLMEMQSNTRPQTVMQNNTGDSSAVRALLEEQKKKRQLEGALELMKRGSELMNQSNPKLT